MGRPPLPKLPIGFQTNGIFGHQQIEAAAPVHPREQARQLARKRRADEAENDETEPTGE